MTDPMVDIATLTARVLAAAAEWREGTFATSDLPRLDLALCDAVDAFQAACGPRPLTWGTVPAGWEVQAPDGKWYRVTATGAAGRAGWQRVVLEVGTWDRAADGPVTARPSATNPTDVALAALGFPEILEDRS